MNNDLIERYIYAVTKKLPLKIRQDVSIELNSLIYDMLDERCGDISPSEKDIRVVLTELGTPSELAEQYNPDKDKCLIGSPYYSQYIFVLKIVLICTAGGTFLAKFIDCMISGNAQPLYAVLDIISSIIFGVVIAYAVVTFIFTILYHKKIKINSLNESLDNLPPVPSKITKISKAECIFGIVFSLIFAIVFIATPQIIGFVNTDNQFISFLDTDAIHSAWYIILIFALTGIVKEIIKLTEGTYTLKATLAVIIDDVISAITAVVWLLNFKIVNPEFTNQILLLSGSNNPDSTAIITKLFDNFNYFFLAVMMFALTLECVTTIIKHIENK